MSIIISCTCTVGKKNNLIFVLCQIKKILTQCALKIESKYNTYLYRGLPPGPINSPGKESIIAALYPSVNEYLYFVARGDGYHTFSTNEKDHNKAKKKFQEVRRRVKLQKNRKIEGN